MSVLVTNTGGPHFQQLTDGDPLTNTFDTLILGAGNDTPDVADVEASITSQITVDVPTASPVLGDTDARNSGRGAAVWTWTFRVSAAAVPIVASNVGLGSSTGANLAMHADEVTWTEPYRDLLVWFNLPTATPGTLTGSQYGLVTAFEENPVEAARLRGNGARADVLYGGPGGQALRVGEVHSTIRAGEVVLLFGRLYGEDQQPLAVADVRRVIQKIDKYDGSSGSWVNVRSRMIQNSVTDGLEFGALFPYRGGYNFRATLPGSETKDGADRRISYEILLSDGNMKVLRQTVRVAV